MEKGYGRQFYSTVAAVAGSQEQKSACNELEFPPSDEGTKPDTAVDDKKQPDPTSEEDKPPLQSRLKSVDIDVETEFLEGLCDMIESAFIGIDSQYMELVRMIVGTLAFVSDFEDIVLPNTWCTVQDLHLLAFTT
jgi:hypothetical protein